MKKTVLFLLALLPLMFSCSVKTPYRQGYSIIDYSIYTNKGFFITESNSVSFGYEAMGSVYAVVESGYEVIGSKQVREIGDDIYSSKPKLKTKLKYGDYIEATPEQALDLIYKKALDIDANGIINLNIKQLTQYIEGYGYIIRGYIVEGMAIKRK